MIIKKILEYNEKETKESYKLSIDKDDEGWELTRGEMDTLVSIIERSLSQTQPPYPRNIMSGIDSFSAKLDDSEECPDKIEPPVKEPVVSKSMGLDIQVPEETTENVPTPKATRQEERDFSAYAKMYAKNADRGTITREMVKDWGITESTATSYYYSKVKPEGDLLIAKGHEREVEREKKSLAAHLEKKIEVIPSKKHDQPSGQKYFSDEDRERIQKELGLK